MWKGRLLILEKILSPATKTGPDADALKYSTLSEISSGFLGSHKPSCALRPGFHRRFLRALLNSLNAGQEDPDLFYKPQSDDAPQEQREGHGVQASSNLTLLYLPVLNIRSVECKGLRGLVGRKLYWSKSICMSKTESR